MSKSKNILFVTHHNNDLDHFLPLAVHLRKDQKMHVKMIAFFTEHELLKNKLHKYICDSNNINFDSMIDVMNFGFLNKGIFKIYRYAIMNRGLSNPIYNRPASNGSKQEVNILKNILLKTAYFFKNPMTDILKLLEFIFIRYVVLCSIFFVTKKKMLNYIDLNNIDLVIIDHRRIEESLLDSNPFTRFVAVFTKKTNPMDLALFRFAKVVRDKNIPLFMMPHGPQPVLISEGERGKLINPFNPDYLVVSSQNDLIVHPHMQSSKSTFFLGDPRFDIDWINYLESCALKVYEGVVEKPKDKKVLLHLLDNAVYSSDKNYKFELHKDVLSLVNNFNCIEIWVKHHPRHVFDFPLDDFIQNGLEKNIKQFGNDVDTTILIANADICVTAGSTTLISPILQKRPVIFYKKWKEIQDAPTIYDNLKFNADSKEELIAQCEKVINGEYEIEQSYIDYFYKNVFSGNYLYENMAEKYEGKIREIINIGHGNSK